MCQVLFLCRHIWPLLRWHLPVWPGRRMCSTRFRTDYTSGCQLIWWMNRYLRQNACQATLGCPVYIIWIFLWLSEGAFWAKMWREIWIAYPRPTGVNDALCNYWPNLRRVHIEGPMKTSCLGGLYSCLPEIKYPRAGWAFVTLLELRKLYGSTIEKKLAYVT